MLTRTIFSLCPLLLLLCSPVTGHHWPGPQCCLNQTVGGLDYTLITPDGHVPEWTECIDNCTYKREDKPYARFCFAPGKLAVTCHDEDLTVVRIFNQAGGNFPNESQWANGTVKFSDGDVWQYKVNNSDSTLAFGLGIVNEVTATVNFDSFLFPYSVNCTPYPNDPLVLEVYESFAIQNTTVTEDYTCAVVPAFLVQIINRAGGIFSNGNVTFADGDIRSYEVSNDDSTVVVSVSSGTVTEVTATVQFIPLLFPVAAICTPYSHDPMDPEYYDSFTIQDTTLTPGGNYSCAVFPTYNQCQRCVNYYAPSCVNACETAPPCNDQCSACLYVDNWPRCFGPCECGYSN